MRARARYVAFFAMVVATTQAAARADDDSPVLPAGARLVFPQRAGIDVKWALPPSANVPADAAIAVTADGVLSLVLGKRALFVPSQAALFLAEKPFEDLFWLPSGNAIARSGGSLGHLRLSPRGKLPRVVFEPLFGVPYPRWRLLPASDLGFYVLGHEPTRGRNEIAAFGPAVSESGAPSRVVYSTDAEINAVAGSGKVVFFATGRGIFVVLPGAAKAEVLFVHPKRDIRELAYLPNGALVYATAEGVGYLHGRTAHEFLVFPGCRLSWSGGTLSVVLGATSNGVLRISGLTTLSGAEPRKDP